MVYKIMFISAIFFVSASTYIFMHRGLMRVSHLLGLLHLNSISQIC